MNIIAIDPGTESGAYVVWDLDGKKLVDKGELANEALLDFLKTQNHANEVYCEMIASYGMAVGKEVFETCIWIGRAQQITLDRAYQFTKIYRQQVKLHHCHTVKAKDANIRQALLDKFGVVGTRKNPGPLYGVATHIWSALAIATYVAEKRNLVAKGLETY